MENIHDHRWNFASAVIKGPLKMEIFAKTASETKQTFFEHNYVPANNSDQYEAKLVGLADLKLIEEREFESGQYYYLAKEELHRVKIENNNTVTIVMTGKPTNNACRLFSSNLFHDDQKSIIKYTKSELINILENI
jgi:hypothetical protein